MQTGQAFTKRVLSPHLCAFNIFADARCVLASKDMRRGRKHSGGFVSYSKAKQDACQKVDILESHLKKEIETEIKNKHFIPCIQLHEFEALIPADPKQLGWEYLEHEKAIANLIVMVGNQNPELINNSRETAPSKRILREIPEYNKATGGPAIAEKIGLSTHRKKCPHFHKWLSTLEQLNKDTHPASSANTLP
ncbi:MAG: DUF4276 family protein [Oxalobacter formigenes]|nr:DUF4276 family protein [Oxalobacter formigenes]